MKKSKKEKRKRLVTHWTKFYLSLTISFVVGFGFFLSSKAFFTDEVDILYTEIGKELSLGSKGKLTIKEWIFDEAKNKMQITLTTDGITNYLSDLDFKSVSRLDVNKELPTDIVYSSNDIYIIKIDNVPKNFQQVALRLVKNEVNLDNIFEDKKEKVDDKNNVVTSIYTDQHVVDHSDISSNTVKDYAIKITNEMIAEVESKIENSKKDIRKNEMLIERIQKEISKLKEELIYQTVDEQTTTNNQVFNLEKQIESYHRNIEIINNDIEAFNAKIERLTQRKRDLEY